jgi:hypothetical protein
MDPKNWKSGENQLSGNANQELRVGKNQLADTTFVDTFNLK